MGLSCGPKWFVVIRPKTIKNIEFIDNPGVKIWRRYRLCNQYQNFTFTGWLYRRVLISLMQWQPVMAMIVYTRWNHSKSEQDLLATSLIQTSKGNQYTEDADYLLQDGTHHQILGDDLRSVHFHQYNLELKYNLADSALISFRLRFPADLSRTPGDYHDNTDS